MAKGGVCKTLIQRFDSARRLHLSPSPTCSFRHLILPLSLLLSLIVAPVCVALQTEQKAGVLEAIRADARLVTIAHGATRARYQVVPGTVIIRNRSAAKLEDLTAGLEVNVRYRKTEAEPYVLYDLVDAGSWKWLQRMRREVVSGRVQKTTSQGIILEDDKEQGQLSYRVTDKTRWEFADGTSGIKALKTGQKVWVAPRLLPNGTTMATGVADTELGAMRLRERAQPTVTGTVKSWDPQKRELTLRTQAQDERVLTVTEDCTIRQDGRDVTVEALRPGMFLTAHLRRAGLQSEQAYRITIKKAPPVGK